MALFSAGKPYNMSQLYRQPGTGGMYHLQQVTHQQLSPSAKRPMHGQRPYSGASRQATAKNTSNEHQIFSYSLYRINPAVFTLPFRTNHKRSCNECCQCRAAPVQQDNSNNNRRPLSPSLRKRLPQQQTNSIRLSNAFILINCLSV